MYFPTLVEVPIAKMFLDLGMHRGPLLAYLMADPELSLQSILIISAIIGRRKTATYVGLVALFSTAAGLTYGSWVDGTSLVAVALAVAAFIAVLAALVSRASALPSRTAKRNLTMLTIKVLRPRLRQLPQARGDRAKALADAGVEGEVVKVTDTPDIVAAGVLKTPGLAINGKLVSSGRIPAPESVLQWIREAQADELSGA